LQFRAVVSNKLSKVIDCSPITKLNYNSRPSGVNTTNRYRLLITVGGDFTQTHLILQQFMLIVIVSYIDVAIPLMFS